MKTPKEDPSVLIEWERIEEEMLKEGVPKLRIWKEIAEFYDTSRYVPQYWLYDRHRERDRNRDWSGRYHREPYRKEYDRRYKYFMRHLSEYASQAFDEGDVLELKEIADKVGDIAKEDPKVGRKIVMESDTVKKRIENMNMERFEQVSEDGFKYLGDGD